MSGATGESAGDVSPSLARNSHPALKDFDETWRDRVAAFARDSQPVYLAAKKKLDLLRILAGIAFVALGTLCFLVSDRALVMVLIVAAVAIPGGLLFLSKGPWEVRNRLRKRAKAQLMDRLCSGIELRFSEDASDFEVGDFARFTFPGNARKLPFECEDHIVGTYDGVGFELCETLLIHRSGSNSSFGFQGLLLRLEYGKEFSGETWVVPKREDLRKIGLGGLANLPERLQSIGLPERNMMEDVRFEKLFNAYATDPVEARYLLTPTFLERLTELPKVAGGQRVECAFIGSRLLVAVAAEGNQFEMDGLLENPDDTSVRDRFNNQLATIFRLIDSLNMSPHTRA